jgi:monoamine oxidase
VLRDFRKLKPEFNVDPVEVHIYRRGHPMLMSTPGTYTRVIPAASAPLERVFFANTDSEGPISTADGAIHSAQKAVEWVKKKLAGGS